MERIFSKEDDILRSIRDYSEKQDVSYMEISAYEGGIVQFLCKAFQIKKAVEIGTLHGYSSLMIARTLPENGRLFTLDIDQKRQEKAKSLMENAPSAAKIHFLPGPAMESLEKLKKEAPFDMLFIDADKGAYLDYLYWGNEYLKSGGLLVADNTFLFGAVYGKPERKQSEKTLSVMKQFNKEIATSGLYISTLIPTAEGLTVGIKK